MIIDVKDIYSDYKKYIDKEVVLQGWVRNHRKQKEFGFIDFNDGTYFKPVQVVYDDKLESFEEIQKIKIGSAIEVKGTVISSPAKGQDFELQVIDIKLLTVSSSSFIFSLVVSSKILKCSIIKFSLLNK